MVEIFGTLHTFCSVSELIRNIRSPACAVVGLGGGDIMDDLVAALGWNAFIFMPQTKTESE